MNLEQSLADGAAGAALLHIEAGNTSAAFDALRRAASGGLSIAAGASLFYGAPALAFVLAVTEHPQLEQARTTTAEGTRTVTRQRLDAAHRRIDHRQQPHYAEYDLISGLTGLGVVLRRLGDHDLLRHVLRYLVRLTEPINDLPGWWCCNGPERHQTPPVGGHANFGMAHGITGPLTLLSLAARDGITVDGHKAAINHICQWLDTWQQRTTDTIWWPQTLTLTDLHHRTPTQQHPLRPSWCYGTPGIARAQQLAAQALGDLARHQLADDAFTTCIGDPAQTRQLTDRTLCHGTAGLLASTIRIHNDTLTPFAVEPIEILHRNANAAPGEPDGLLTGSIGPDLIAAGSTTSWDACLLLA